MTSAAQQHQQQQRQQPVRVLVVEDDQTVAAVVAKVLAGWCDVAIAHAPQQALARFAAGERFDVVLCDLHLPGTDGPHLRAAVSAVAPAQAARFVWMSGDESGLPAADGLPRISKPFAVETLRAVVRQAAATAPAAVDADSRAT